MRFDDEKSTAQTVDAMEMPQGDSGKGSGSGRREWWHGQGFLTAAVIFQVMVLLAMIGLAARPLVAAGSRTVLLQVEPVDPRDLFRGDYVTLSYAVSRVPSQFAPGQTVYVELLPAPDGLHYRQGSAGMSPFGSGVFLQGRVLRPGFAEFGVEKYFVPEGQGHDYERAVRERRLWAEVVVAPDGQGALKRLVIE